MTARRLWNIYTPFTLTAKQIHETAVDKGFYEKPASFIEKLYLIGSEIFEAGDKWIKKQDDEVQEELADVMIRLLDFWQHYIENPDIEGAIDAKMKKNADRPKMHGGKRL